MRYPLLPHELFEATQRKRTGFQPIQFRIFGQFPGFKIENKHSPNKTLIFSYEGKDNKLLEVYLDQEYRIIGKYGVHRNGLRPKQIHNSSDIRIFRDYFGLGIVQCNQLENILRQVFQHVQAQRGR